MTTNMKREMVIDQWSMIVTGGAGQSARIMTDIENILTEAKMPGVKFFRDDCTAGFFSGKRDFLILWHGQPALKNYRIFLGARDYGSSLDASWFLTFVPTLFHRKVNSQNLDIFTQQDLRAFASTVHHCMQAALEALCGELEQDQTGLHTSSKGFLSVW
jgi:hypothetical protein